MNGGQGVGWGIMRGPAGAPAQARWGWHHWRGGMLERRGRAGRKHTVGGLMPGRGGKRAREGRTEPGN